MSDDLVKRLLSVNHMTQGDGFAATMETAREAAAEISRLRAQVEAADGLARVGPGAVEALRCVGSTYQLQAADYLSAALANYQQAKESRE